MTPCCACREWTASADKPHGFASFHRITSRQARRSSIEVGAVGASDRNG